ncbi:MAG: preprotein translocase subunit SecE [Phycisphaerae bacterium]|nr:preprotein translocase subunit SecE [Phycisphaerae bacterium]
MALKIYKRGQGKYTRSVTFAVGALISALVGHEVWKHLDGSDLSYWSTSVGPVGLYLVYGIPLLVFAGIVAVVYLAVNRQRSADFMIATEGEMKKVSWSSRREIIGGTKVVIATTFILASVLYVVDLGFLHFFKWIGVLQIAAED